MAAPLLKHRHRSGPPHLRSVLGFNTYLTDESRLFRCLGWDGSLILLEDCVSMEVFAYPEHDLAAAAWRLVTPTR